MGLWGARGDSADASSPLHARLADSSSPPPTDQGRAPTASPALQAGRRPPGHARNDGEWPRCAGSSCGRSGYDLGPDLGDAMEDAGRDGATRDTGKGAAQGTLPGPRMGRAQKVRMLAGTAAATAARGKKPGVLSQSVSFPVQGAAAMRTYPDHE